MIDLSNLKAPGWQRVLSELLTPASDDQTFLTRLVAVLAQVSASRQAVLLAIDPGAADDPNAPPSASEPRPVLVWPPSEMPGTGLPPIEQTSSINEAARAASESQQVRVFGVEPGQSYYGESEQAYVIAAPLPQPAPTSGDAPANAPRAVVTLLIDSRSKQAIQSTVAMVEVLVGYTLLHASRQQFRRARASTAALDLAARLLASVNSTESFKGACYQLVNDLQRQIRADRVALGWVEAIGDSGNIKVRAISDTENIDHRMAMVQKLRHAMEECLDQEQAVLYPPPVSTGAPGEAAPDPALAQAVTHAHRELVAADARMKAVSIPLRDRDKVLGVVTLESAIEGAADLSGIELLQAALDLVAPVLAVRESDDRPLYTRAYASSLRAGEWLVGPKHTAWKLAGVAVIVATLLVTLVRTEYRVEAPVEIQPRARAIVAAPFAGVIATLGEGIAPGRAVKKGDVLLELDTREIQLRILDSSAKMTQAQKEADAALKAGNRQSEFQQAQARAAQAEAGLRRAQLELELATLRAPIDGTIIAGDLQDRVGASIQQGDALFQIAALDDMLVVARLSDRDIALVRDQFSDKGPSTGDVATKASPADRRPFVVERIVPLAQAKDGKNAFEVRGRLTTPVPGLRPGMEGIAKFNVGRHSILYIGTRRIHDQLRLWLWW